MYQAIVLLPLVGFLIVGLFGNQMGAKASEYTTSGLLIVSAILSWIAFISFGFGEGETLRVPLLQFIQSGTLDVSCSPGEADVVIAWTERGGPVVEPPTRQAGYGSQLVARTISRHLGGSIAHDWSSEGLIVTLRLDKARLAS